jgi:hypothetical protein
LLGGGQRGGAVVVGDCGVSPLRAYEQRPYHTPVAPQAGAPQRRIALIIAAVDADHAACVTEQQAHDLEVAFLRSGHQGSPGIIGDGGIGPRLQKQPHYGEAALVTGTPQGGLPLIVLVDGRPFVEQPPHHLETALDALPPVLAVEPAWVLIQQTPHLSQVTSPGGVADAIHGAGPCTQPKPSSQQQVALAALTPIWELILGQKDLSFLPSLARPVTDEAPTRGISESTQPAEEVTREVPAQGFSERAGSKSRGGK